MRGLRSLAESRYECEAPPASALVGTSGLAFPEQLMETKLVAKILLNRTFQRDPGLTQSGDQTNRCSTGSPRCEHYVAHRDTAQPLTSGNNGGQTPLAT
jgi:hypothetical protein